MGKINENRYSETKQIEIAELMMLAYAIAPGEKEKDQVQFLCKELEGTAEALARLVARWEPAICFEGADLEEPDVGGLCAAFKQDLICLELPHPMWMEFDPGVEEWNCRPPEDDDDDRD